MSIMSSCFIQLMFFFSFFFLHSTNAHYKSLLFLPVKFFSQLMLSPVGNRIVCFFLYSFLTTIKCKQNVISFNPLLFGGCCPKKSRCSFLLVKFGVIRIICIPQMKHCPNSMIQKSLNIKAKMCIVLLLLPGEIGLGRKRFWGNAKFIPRVCYQQAGCTGDQRGCLVHEHWASTGHHQGQDTKRD